MMRDASEPAVYPNPPASAERLLRCLLETRNRDTITGDLLEEYRENVLPARGAVRARVWYLRQVLSFVTLPGLMRALGPVGEDDMTNRLSRTSLSWTVAGSLALAAIIALLIRSNFGPPPPPGLAIAAPVAVALGLAGLASLRSRADLGVLWRAGLAWGALLATVMLVRLLLETFAPIDPLDRFLAQSRADYSEFDYPRRWLPAVAAAMVFMAAGFRTAWRTGQVAKGTLAAMIASATGSLAYITLVVLASMLPMGSQDPLGNTPRDLQYFGNVPAGLAPVLLMFSAVLGTVGAMFGRGLGTDRTTGPRAAGIVNPIC
jgi:hypothetical protein